MDNQHALLEIQICFATPTEVHCINVKVPEGTTIAQALKASSHEKDFYAQIPHFEITEQVYGIFGKKKSIDTLLKKGDRIEIYRPLIANPMDARRSRVNKVSKINVKN